MQESVYSSLFDLGVNSQLRIKFKDIFGIHLKLVKGIEFDEIHDIMIINDDRVTVIAENDNITCSEEWLFHAQTSYARKKIRQYIGK